MRNLFILLFSFSSMLQAQVLFDFQSAPNLEGWQIVNDGVMGGLSEGTIVRTKEGYGRFFGTVSLENYGGFTSARYALPVTQVNEESIIVLKVKGDRKPYQFRVKHQRSDYYTYVSTFSTSGEWETIEIPLASLRPQWRGRRVDLPDFDRKSISEMTLLIANKKNESFELQIASIQLK